MNARKPHPIHFGRLFGCALLALAVCGQARAQIEGQVTGPTGANLTGLRVVACDPTTNRVVQATVDASGRFRITGADPGTYEIAVFGPGFAPQTFRNIQVVQGQTVTQNITLAAREPVCINKVAAPIPLTDDINSAAFADAPDILINTGCNIVEGLANISNFRGPSTLSGRFRLKYSTQALHLAGDVILPQPNVNFGSDTELWKGNSIEILFQDDPFNATRTQIDPMHNFRVVIALTDPPRWRFGTQLEQTPQEGGQPATIANFVSVKNRADNMGNLIRVNIPWSFFVTGGTGGTAIQPPQDNAQLAMDIRLNTTVPGATATTADRQFQLSWSGLAGTEPRSLIPVRLCP